MQLRVLLKGLAEKTSLVNKKQQALLAVGIGCCISIRISLSVHIFEVAKVIFGPRSSNELLKRQSGNASL